MFCCLKLCSYLFLLLCYLLFSLVSSGDTETNPGPRKSSPVIFFYWNLSGMAAHDFIKALLIETFITTSNLVILCVSKTYFHSAIDLHDENRSTR